MEGVGAEAAMPALEMPALERAAVLAAADGVLEAAGLVPAPLGFSDLAVGEVFDFAWGRVQVQDPALPHRGGPYVKLGPRRYRYAEEARNAALRPRGHLEIASGFKRVRRVPWPPQAEAPAQAACEPATVLCAPLTPAEVAS
jgi:hypothetical protein